MNTPNQPTTLRPLWKTWLVFTVIVAIPALFIKITDKSLSIPVTLQANFQTQWRTWRPFDTQRSWFEMAYQRSQNTEWEKELLGEYAVSQHSEEHNAIVFTNTGEPVLIQLQVNGKGCVFEQPPASSFSKKTVSRDLIADDGKPSTTYWFELPQCYLAEHAGWNDWQLKVVSVGDKLKGAETVLWMHSPYGNFKTMPTSIYGKLNILSSLLSLVVLPFWALYTLVMLVITSIKLTRKK